MSDLVFRRACPYRVGDICTTYSNTPPSSDYPGTTWVRMVNNHLMLPRPGTRAFTPNTVAANNGIALGGWTHSGNYVTGTIWFKPMYAQAGYTGGGALINGLPPHWSNNQYCGVALSDTTPPNCLLLSVNTGGELMVTTRGSTIDVNVPFWGHVWYISNQYYDCNGVIHSLNEANAGEEYVWRRTA